MREDITSFVSIDICHFSFNCLSSLSSSPPSQIMHSPIVLISPICLFCFPEACFYLFHFFQKLGGSTYSDLRTISAIIVSVVIFCFPALDILWLWLSHFIRKFIRSRVHQNSYIQMSHRGLFICQSCVLVFEIFQNFLATLTCVDYFLDWKQKKKKRY